MDSGIKMAFLKGIFEDISVELDDDRTHVKIRVKERNIIRNIYIKGNKHVKKKALAELFLFKEGQVMRYDLIEHSERELRGHYPGWGSQCQGKSAGRKNAQAL